MTGTNHTALEAKADQWAAKLFGVGHPVTLHLQRTLYWLATLCPGADAALRLAALTHDVQRAEEIRQEATTDPVASLTGTAYLAHHQQRGAELVAQFLTREGADRALVQRVSALVGRHETGGDEDLNILLDADSLSFFENSVAYLLDPAGPSRNLAGLRTKFEWMFTRMVSDQARELARPLYWTALDRLGSAPVAPLKAVIWDMGGIMYHFFTELLVEQGRVQNWPLERLPLGPTGPGPDPLYRAMDQGELDEGEYVRRLVLALQAEGIALEPYCDLHLARHDRPQAWTTIARVGELGYRQAALTNDATRWLGDCWWETWPHRQEFEAIVDVANLGIRKPAPEPYRACAGALQLPPEACLFVDDMHVNCRGAEAVGMCSFWFDITAPEESFARLLDHLAKAHKLARPLYEQALERLAE